MCHSGRKSVRICSTQNQPGGQAWRAKPGYIFHRFPFTLARISRHNWYKEVYKFMAMIYMVLESEYIFFVRKLFRGLGIEVKYRKVEIRKF